MRRGLRVLGMLTLLVIGAKVPAQNPNPSGASVPAQNSNPGAANVQGQQNVAGSLHDLTVPGNSKSPGVCTYCHAPHHTAPINVGLWNHQLSSSQYQFYTSSTYKEGTPVLASNSPSRLCLSCHDGTVALGSTYNSNAPLPTKRSLSSAGNVGTDLRTDHPFAFGTWVRDNSLLDVLFSTTPRATANSAVTLPNGEIECTTCHEPHIQNIDSKRAEFLVVNNANGTMCQACHDVNKPSPNVLSGWLTSAHALAATTEGASVTGYRSVGEGACMNCHTPHGGSSDRLLRSGEEQACFTCHANKSSSSLWAQVWIGNGDPTKFMHPVQAPGHDPNENLLAASTPRHAKCWDCHNLHAAKTSSPSMPPAAESALAQATGINAGGSPVTAVNEYEVCFKCHADSANKPQTTPGYNKYGYMPVRQVDATNVRLDFNSPFARHNVTQARSGAMTPADRPAILKLDGSQGRALSGGYLYCTDCHNSDNATVSGGSGPNGPHISAFEHLLERRYDMNRAPAVQTMMVMSLNVPVGGGDPLAGPFAVCNKCHNVAQLLTPAGDTVFRHHASHVVGGGISCAVCHSPHGVQTGSPAQHGHSVNLDISIVRPDPKTLRLEIDTASRTCYVACHFSNDRTGLGVHSGTAY